MGLENLIQRSIRVVQRISACQSMISPLQASPLRTPAVPLAPSSEPIQVDSFHLSHSERQCRIHNNLCLYCGSNGHLIPDCPVSPPRPVVSTVQLPWSVSTLQHTTLSVTTPHLTVTAQDLLDLGSAGNFISKNLLQQLGIKKCPCTKALNISLHPGKTAGQRADTSLHTCHLAPYRQPALGEDFTIGAKGFNCWYHPRTPLVTETLSFYLLVQWRHPQMDASWHPVNFL